MPFVGRLMGLRVTSSNLTDSEKQIMHFFSLYVEPMKAEWDGGEVRLGKKVTAAKEVEQEGQRRAHHTRARASWWCPSLSPVTIVYPFKLITVLIDAYGAESAMPNESHLSGHLCSVWSSVFCLSLYHKNSRNCALLLLLRHTGHYAKKKPLERV